MLLKTTLGKQQHQFEVTPIADEEKLYFLIQLAGNKLILAHHATKNNEWTQAGADEVSKPLMKAIFNTIEHASAYILLDNVVSLDQFKTAA